MKTVVIMPGGFHPFHAGHYALYKQAQDAFPGADVYVAATNDTSTRPFPFALKEKLAKLAGVNPGKFIQVKSPFQAREVTDHFDPADTQLIFVRSEKDADKPPRAGGVKKDGNPAYLQPLEGQDELAPMAQHAYMAYLPTVEFGPGMTSATEIRTAWPRLNEKRKTALVMSLYPKTQGNLPLAANVVKMLDTAMGAEELNEFSFGGDDDDTPKDDPYKYPKPEQYRRSIDFFGKFEANHFDKEDMNDATGEFKGYWYYDGKPRQIAYFKFNNPQRTGSNDPGMGWYYEPQDEDIAEGSLNEFAPDDSGGSRKFIPWPEFIDAVKQIVGKDFSVKENVVKSTIKARFIPHDPMDYGPTMLYSYYEARAGRNKGAVSTRGSIQVGKYFNKGSYFNSSDPDIQNQLLTSFNLLKGHPFERHFDLTFDNIYKIANIIMGNTEGAYQMPQQQGVAEDYVAEKK